MSTWFSKPNQFDFKGDQKKGRIQPKNFCVLRELIFAISTDLLICWEFIFAIFRKYQSPALTIFSFLLSTCNRNAYFLGQYYGVRQYFIVYRFVSERKRQVVIEQTRFLSTVFLCSKFKSENIYSGVNFCGKMFCGNFQLRQLIFVDR